MRKLFIIALALFVLSGCDYLGYFDSADGGNGGSNPASYTISFDANGGTGTMSNETVEEGSTYTIPVSGFSGPSGTLRRFAGWNTKADGTGTSYAASDSAAITADTTLYAQWTNPLFSVASDKKVYFSKGNLYWDGCAFKMYDNQYGRESTWDASKIDKFYWSKSASVAYSSSSYLDGEKSTSDIFFAADGGAIAGWTVLTSSSVDGEWKYLLEDRVVNSGTGEGKSYQRATINSDAT